MNRKIKFAPGEYYHIYNRGVDKRKIFLDDRDYERFLSLLFLANAKESFEINKNPNEEWSFKQILEKEIEKTSIVSIGAWVLMPNHFHLLVRESGDGNVSKFMKNISSAYAYYFNKKYHRTGALFEGRFKAEHVNEDRYLKYLYSYIHLNPIGIIDKAWKQKQISDLKNAQKFLVSYEYSSLKDFLGGATSQDGDRDEIVILDKTAFPGYFETSAKFREMLDEWMNFEKA